MVRITDCLPLAEVDILGREDGSDYIFGNAVLAELTRHARDDGKDEAAIALEDDQLGELTAPAMNLLKVEHKLAVAARLGGWCLDREPGSYGAMLARLLASALSDMIVLRHAEMRRRELLA